MQSPTDVLVCGEIYNDSLAPITSELIGGAKQIAKEVKSNVLCLLVGNKVNQASKEAIACGANKIYKFQHDSLNEYVTEVYLEVLERINNKLNPRIILIGHTDLGRDLAPRAAFRFKSGLTMDCIKIRYNTEKNYLEKIKPIYGGNALAVYHSLDFPEIATIRPKSLEISEKNYDNQGEEINIDFDIESYDQKVNIIETIKEKYEGIKLEDAAVVVSGGRGIGGEEGFKLLEELSNLLKGAVGASRPACDNKWVSESAQVGLTGKIVSPDLYIAVGISGSSQHLTGCSGSKNIVAINKDPNAIIFKNSNYGVVGDYKAVLPRFINRVKELL